MIIKIQKISKNFLKFILGSYIFKKKLLYIIIIPFKNKVVCQYCATLKFNSFKFKGITFYILYIGVKPKMAYML